MRFLPDRRRRNRGGQQTNLMLRVMLGMMAQTNNLVGMLAQTQQLILRTRIVDQTPHFPTPQPGLLHRALTAWWWTKAVIMIAVVLIIIGVATPFVLKAWGEVSAAWYPPPPPPPPYEISAAEVLRDLRRTRQEAEILRLRIIALGPRLPPAVRGFHLDHAHFGAYEAALEKGTNTATVHHIRIELDAFCRQMSQVESYITLMERR